MPMTSPISEKIQIYDLGDLRQLIASIAHLPDDTPVEIEGDGTDVQMQVQLFERSWGEREQGRAVRYDENDKAVPVKVPVLIFSETEL